MTPLMLLLLAIPLTLLASLRLAERQLRDHCWVPTARQRRQWRRERLVLDVPNRRRL